MKELAVAVRGAMDGPDMDAMAELLHPDVRWGAPGGPATCRNKGDVVSWYADAMAKGRRGTVNTVDVVGDRLVVEIAVHGTEDARQRGGTALRWQVLAVRDGLVADIVGFDDHAEALTAASDGVGTTGH